jgi:hypothetical protein
MGFNSMYNVLVLVMKKKIKKFNQYQQNKQSPLTSKDHDIRRWESGSSLGTGTKMVFTYQLHISI